MKVIPCFWTQFPLPSTLHVLGLFIIYTVNALVAIREGLIQFVAEKVWTGRKQSKCSEMGRVEGGGYIIYSFGGEGGVV